LQFLKKDKSVFIQIFIEGGSYFLYYSEAIGGANNFRFNYDSGQNVYFVTWNPVSSGARSSTNQTFITFNYDLNILKIVDNPPTRKEYLNYTLEKGYHFDTAESL